MNFENYAVERQNLLNEVQELLNAGNVQESNEKMEQIKKHDEEFENFKVAQANMNALKDNAIVTNIQNKGVNVMNGVSVAATENVVHDDVYASLDYRKAFMNHIVKGDAMPAEFKNAHANTKTTDIGEMIPTTVLEKIIEKIEATGMILSEVTRTAYKGGVSIPTSNVKPVATWVAEGQGSDKQKKTLAGSITFAYHKLRCAVSVSLEVDTMALPVFEATLIQNIAEAMVKAIEVSILTGSGVGQPKGIFTETPNEGQALTASELNYQLLCDAEAALPLEYENGAVYLMTKKTFMAYQAMTDANGQPIARVTYGIGGKPERTLLGRRVILNNYMESFTASTVAGTVFAALFNLKDYVLNTNLNIGLKRYEDNETDDLVTKSIMLVDGKVLIKDSLVTIAKK